MRSNQTQTAPSSVNARSGAILSIAFISGEFNNVARSKAAFFERSGCDLLASREDFLAELALAALENPDQNASQIVSIVTNKGKQARSKSAIARLRLDDENDTDAIEIIAPEASSIAEYRLLDEKTEGEIDTIRARIRADGNVTDRAARQRLASAAKRAETADENDLFGRASFAAALKNEGAKK